MADIRYWKDSIVEEIGHIQSILDGVQSLSDPVERALALEEADATLKSATGTKRAFKMEIRLVQDQDSRSKYTKLLKKLENELRTLKVDLKALQVEEDGNVESDPTMAGSNMLNETSKLQDKTQDSLVCTKNMVAASKEVGLATLEELQMQQEVIGNIDRETDRLGHNLTRAEALVKRFRRRMAR